MPAIGQPVQGYYYDQATDTLRPIAAQASTVDLPGRHRYAITPPPDLVDGQLWLDSDAVISPTSQVPIYADVATRDAQWTSPTNGSMCVTLDTYTTWLRKNGVWQPPPGTVVWNQMGSVGDTSAGVGARDIYTFGPGSNFPYPTVGHASSMLYFGFSSGWVNADASLIALSTGATIAVTPTPVQAAVAGAWAALTVNGVWSIAANAVPSFKGRVNASQIQTGVIHTFGTFTAFYVAA